jgi:hypothetical protein
VSSTGPPCFFSRSPDGGVDLARHLPHPARHDVAAAQLVEDGAADALPGEGQERLLRVSSTLGGPGQAEHAAATRSSLEIQAGQRRAAQGDALGDLRWEAIRRSRSTVGRRDCWA